MIRVAGPELTCTSGGGGPWNHSDEQQCFGRPVLNSSKYSLFNLCETSLFFSTFILLSYEKGCNRQNYSLKLCETQVIN